VGMPLPVSMALMHRSRQRSRAASATGHLLDKLQLPTERTRLTDGAGKVSAFDVANRLVLFEPGDAPAAGVVQVRVDEQQPPMTRRDPERTRARRGELLAGSRASLGFKEEKVETSHAKPPFAAGASAPRPGRPR